MVNYQGLCLSNLLRSKCISNSTMRTFADDTSVSYASNSAYELLRVINLELKSLNSQLIANKLSLNIAKTEFMAIESQQKMAAINDELAIKMTVRSRGLPLLSL